MKKINIPITEPCLKKVADLIIEKHKSNKSNDFSKDIVVLPGSRAGRRLLEILCEKTSETNTLFSPPQFLTPGRFCEQIIETSKIEKNTISSNVEEIFAWTLAFEKETEAVKVLLNKSVKENYNYLPFAMAIRQIYNELSGDLIFFEDVVKIVAENEREVERWTALSQIYKSYLTFLESEKITDKATSITRILFSENKEKAFAEFNALENVFVVGVVDMFERFRAAIKCLSDKVTIISYGNNEWFDDEGGLLPDINFENLEEKQSKQIKFCSTLSNQAKEVVKFLGGLDEKYSCRDIIISAPDEEIRSPLTQHLTESKIKNHDSIGSIFSQTELGILLKTVSDYLGEKSIKNFLKLINHPAIQNYIFADNKTFSLFTKSLIKFSSEHIIDNIDSEFFNNHTELSEKIEEVETLFSSFFTKSSIKDCIEKINEKLEEIYEKVNQNSKKSYLNSLGKQPGFHLEGIKKWNELSEKIIISKIQIQKKKKAEDIIKMMLQLLTTEKLAPEAEVDTIDIIGWLELPLDDAPVIILTGMNEGIVPESQTSHLFLPNSLRKSLKIQNNDQRLTRDKYYLRTIIKTADKVLITAGKNSATQDPLLPSRLLLDVPEKEQAELLQRFSKITTNEIRVLDSNKLCSCKISNDEGLFLSEKATNLAVTKFKTYLTCPYQFYLKQEKKYPINDLPRELPAFEYGNIVHKVLDDFGKSNLRKSEDFNEIQTLLKKLVDEEVEKRFGKNPHPAILIQKDSIISRLNAFAVKQAERANLKWEIIDTEKKFVIELGDFKINGTIDRIDELHTQKYIIDYKTGKINIKNHHYDNKKERWKDLQLPLYAYWGKKQFDKLPDVGYFKISKKMNEIKLLKYELDEEQVAYAVETAKEIFKKINSKDKDNFKRTDDIKKCVCCDYKKLCNRDEEVYF